MDIEQLMAFLRGGQGTTVKADAQQPGQEELQRRAQQREAFRQQANSPPPPPNDDLYAILQRNLAQPDTNNPDLVALREAAAADIAPIQDMAANAQSDVAALEMLPPLSSYGPQQTTATLSAFQEEPAVAAEQPIAQKHLQIPQEVMPPAPTVPMPQAQSKAPQQTYAGQPTVIGPSGVMDPSFIPPEAMTPPAPPIAPMRPGPAIIGPGGVTGANDPFRPTIRAGGPLPTEQAPPPLAAVQQPGWRPPGFMPAGAPAPRPRPAPAASPQQPTADDLNRAELQRLLASFASSPLATQPPAAPEVPAPAPMAAAPAPQPVPLPPAVSPPPPPAPTLGEAIPPIMREQLLQEAIRLTRQRRETPTQSGAR